MKIEHIQTNIHTHLVERVLVPVHVASRRGEVGNLQNGVIDLKIMKQTETEITDTEKV
jgi:hypothetical protein